MSENIPYIIAENGYYYVAYREKAKVPELVVSSKGVANGLSEEYNDGWDFGPDSYSPTSTSAIPYTQTAGLQEAINFAVTNQESTIMLRDGIYYITAPFVENSTYSVQAQIYLPATANPTHLRITSVSPIQLGIPDGNMSTTGTIIYSKPPSYPSATNSPYPWVIFVEPQYDLEIDILIRQVGTTQQVNGINLYGAYTFHGNIRVDIDAVMDSSAPSSPPSGLENEPVASAIQTPNESNGMGYNHLNISVFGYLQGILLNSQTEIGMAYFSYVFAPVQVSSTLHPKNIWYINNNNCTHLFGLGAVGTQYTEFYVSVADIQDNLNTTSWFELVDHVYYGTPIDGDSFSGTACSGLIRGIRNPQGSTIPYNSPLIFGGSLNGATSTLRVETSAPQSPSTPSVPASGTAQANSNPYAVKVYVQGGAITEIQITIGSNTYTVYSNSTASAVYEGFTLPAGASITLTYSTAPTWSWVPE